MRIIALSDTHGNQPEVPDGDILIHAGDACNFGTDDEIRAALMWISSLPHKHKIFVPGNHDRELETRLSVWKAITEDWGITLLVDESVTIQGASFYGCPWTPQFMDWSFMRTDKQREQYWHYCDAEPDILITHGPPLGILDASGRENIGCEYLRKYVQKSAPHHHIFGHIHEGKGWMKGYDTEFHNVACRVAVIDFPG